MSTPTESGPLLGGSAPGPAPRPSLLNWRTFAAGTAVLAVLLIASGLILTSTPQKQQPAPQAQGSTEPRFRATQFISFTINTLGGLAANGECKGRDVDPTGQCYLGNDKNLTEDVERREKIIREVLGRIIDDEGSKKPVIDHDESVLKIFMVPEFFMRGPHGAYSTAEMFEGGILLDLADRVRDIVRDPRWSDFLFVFGTVIVARTPDDPRRAWQVENITGHDVVYYNFAPVYKGGPEHNHRYIVAKKYISTVDFLSRTKLPNPADSKLRSYGDIPAPLKALLKSRHTTLIENNTIDIDGLRIGLEICLDHRKGQLWENIQAAEQQDYLVDVQLITSAGMSIEAGPNPVVPGGAVYLSDGGASSAACIRDDNATFDPEKVCRGEVAGRKHVPQGGKGYSPFISMATCIDVEEEKLMKGYYSLFQPQGCANTLKTYGIDVMDEFKVYPPSLEIYPTVELPKNTYETPLPSDSRRAA